MVKNERIFAFIDSQNLNLGIKSCGWDLDFLRFFVYLKDKYKVDKAFLFIGYIPGNQKLYTYLQSVGYICIFKPTLEIKNKNKIVVKGNVDADLVLHAMIEFNHYEKAIIVSGDGDFFCLIDYWYQKGKLLHIITPSQKYSSLLKKYAKHIIKIGLLKEKLRRK